MEKHLEIKECPLCGEIVLQEESIRLGEEFYHWGCVMAMRWRVYGD